MNIRLAVNLEDIQNVILREDKVILEVKNSVNRQTILTRYFTLNNYNLLDDIEYRPHHCCPFTMYGMNSVLYYKCKHYWKDYVQRILSDLERFFLRLLLLNRKYFNFYH